MLFCSTPPMKRVCRSFVAVGVLVIVASACGRREAPAPPAATISRHLVGDPPTLDPITSVEEEPIRIVTMILRQLLGVDKELWVVTGLERSWRVTNAGLE